MIGYLEGRLLKKEADRILLLANQVGYEILVPVMVMESMHSVAVGDTLSLYIYYYQTDRQPKPVLIGFNLEVEKDFFQAFISVDAIGPLKAVKAMHIPVREIAGAIEARDVDTLKRLQGIGARTAQKIIATLEGKMGKFALIQKTETEATPKVEDIQTQVLDVLVSQLGHKAGDARRMIAEAMQRNRAIETPEALFEEVYRGEDQKG
jgi:Holliday junction DNA helicase RuvA